MKKLRLAIIAILFTCTFAAISPAKADPGSPCGGSDIDSPCGGGGDSAPGLPINNGVWLLVAAAGVLGTKAIVSKTRAQKAN